MCNELVPSAFSKTTCLKCFICKSLRWKSTMRTEYLCQGSYVLIGLCPMSFAAAGGQNCGCTKQSCICWSHLCMVTMLFFMQKWGKVSLSPYVILISYKHHLEHKCFTGVSEEPPFFVCFFHIAYSSAKIEKQVHGQKRYNQTLSPMPTERSVLPPQEPAFLFS